MTQPDSSLPDDSDVPKPDDQARNNSARRPVSPQVPEDFWSSGGATGAARVVEGESEPAAMSQPHAVEKARPIGPYKLLQRIGEGGMGTVWMADQETPVRRRVALKVIKPGLDNKQVIARFEAERQALAMMDHQNIARVLDAGTTESDQPYFVMELVQGVPFTTYCDQHKLSIAERLELFLPVCKAVQHAHQKGIIHRDLKPSNVLVSLHDGQPVPKVIDFGLAKALQHQSRLTDKTLFTEFGQVVGTLQYMSPEQAEMNRLDIDTRTDIYSLGVMLYELLTGSTPIDRETLHKEGILRVLETIREKDPPSPSLKLTSLSNEEASSISQQRRIELGKLMSTLRGELDWVVMKALEKDRTRRYETANGLAADIERYLQGDVVTARPPSTWYRMQKFVRRNRVGVAAAALILLSLMGGIVGTSLGLVEAQRAQKVADDRRREAEQNLAFARKGNEILGSVFENLDPKAQYSTVAELRNALRNNLDTAITDLEGTAIGDPLDVAAMQETLGISLFGLGVVDRAIEVLSKSWNTRSIQLGPEHPDTLASMNKLAGCHRDAGHFEKALNLYERTLRLRKVHLGPDHPQTLNTMSNMANCYQAAGQLEKALPLYEQTLRRTKAALGPDHYETLGTMGNLASCYRACGQLEEALPLLEELLPLIKAKLGPDHPKTLGTMGSLANCYQAAGQLEKALPLLEETLPLMKAILGPDHPDTLKSINNLAAGYYAAGHLENALPLFEELLQSMIAKLGADHPQTLGTMGNLAAGYYATGELDKAIPLFEETLRLRKSILGSEHPDTLSNMNVLAFSYQSSGQLDKALPLSEEALRMIKAKLGPDHPETLGAINNLAGGYYAAGQLDRALPLFEEALQLTKDKLGADHSQTLMCMANLASGYCAAGDLDKALPLCQEALRLSKENLGADHPQTLTCMGNLALSYQASDQLEKAIPLYEETLQLSKTKLGLEHPSTVSSMNNLAECYRAARLFDQAIRLFEETLELRKAKMSSDQSNISSSLELAKTLVSTGAAYLQVGNFPRAHELLAEGYASRKEQTPNEWPTFRTQFLLGSALVGLERYEEAERLLAEGYDGLKELEASIPPETTVRISEDLDRLIELYMALDRADDADKYRELRAQYREAASEEEAQP